MKTAEEIQAILDKAYEAQRDGQSPFEGMNYIDGVVYALQWILGQSDFDPLDD